MTRQLTTAIATIRHPELARWVEEVALRCQPERIHICDGSDKEYQEMARLMVQQGSAIPLNPAIKPNSLFVRSNPGDVARVEDRTFICSVDPDDAGPTNNWREPHVMRAELAGVFSGSMRGRTLYVVPFSMGPLGGPISQLGVQVTDSPYVVVSMRVM